MPFRPMLAVAAPEDLSAIRFPVLVSPKLDGIRCLIRDDMALSRNLKPIPNAHVQRTLATLPNGLDGELIVGEATDTHEVRLSIPEGEISGGSDVWSRTQSGVMSAEGAPKFAYHVFDFSTFNDPFSARLSRAGVLVEAWGHLPVTLVPHRSAETVEDLMRIESEFVALGYEGAMIRDPSGPYKEGRSTGREGYLLKLKRFKDAEAVVVDVVERFHNGNEAKTNALGLTERSSAKANKVPTGTLGALVCEILFEPVDGPGFSVQFEIGTGFTEAQRKDLWAERHTLEGRLTKFKYQNTTPDGKPRFPVWLGFRDPADL
jgi:DNA ligase-1